MVDIAGSMGITNVFSPSKLRPGAAGEGTDIPLGTLPQIEIPSGEEPPTEAPIAPSGFPLEVQPPGTPQRPGVAPQGPQAPEARGRGQIPPGIKRRVNLHTQEAIRKRRATLQTKNPVPGMNKSEGREARRRNINMNPRRVL